MKIIRKHLFRNGINMINQQEYTEAVVQLLNPSINTIRTKMVYLGTKLFNETGEFVALWCKEKFHGKSLTKDDYIDEAGDCTWYLYNLIGCLDKQLAVKIYEYTDDILKKLSRRELEKITVDKAMVDLTVSSTKFNEVLAACNYEPVFLDRLPGLIRSYLFDLLTVFRALEIDLNEVFDKNLAKLNARYNGKTYNSGFYKQTNSRV